MRICGILEAEKCSKEEQEPEEYVKPLEDWTDLLNGCID